VIDPEKREAMCAYNRNYYVVNRERLVEARKRKRDAQSAMRVRDAG
jgi:hypothetical protein